ncbi:MAG: hypothetical protein U7127_00290 [Phormidium sp.]
MPRYEPPRNKKLDDWYPDDESRTPQREEGKLFDSLRRLFGLNKPSTESSVENVIKKLAPIWETKIVTCLIENFGRGTPLYAIFYAGKYPDEIIMEVWDPQHVNTKPSEVFKFRGIPDDNFPITRAQAEVFTLKNWEKLF